MAPRPNPTPEPSIDAPVVAHESLMKTIDGQQNQSEVRQAAPDFVKRSTMSAKDYSADLHAGAQKMTSAVEQALVKAVSGIAEANRKVIDAAYRDIETALSTIDKMAGAKSFAEAYQAYVDYLRRQSEIGLIRAKTVAGLSAQPPRKASTF
jgi:hypothetical protein